MNKHKDIYHVVEMVLTNLKWISNYVEMNDLSNTANPEEVVENIIEVLEEALKEKNTG
jgi:hypothetical protein